MVRNFIAAIAILFNATTNAAIVDTVSIYSNAMHKEYKAVVIKPDSYKKKKLAFPVVYLLHGHGGWYCNSTIRFPDLKPS